MSEREHAWEAIDLSHAPDQIGVMCNRCNLITVSPLCEKCGVIRIGCWCKEKMPQPPCEARTFGGCRS